MLWFPRNVGALAAIPDTGNGKFSLANLCVRPVETGWYRVEATNGKIMAIVCGPSTPPKTSHAGDDVTDTDGINADLLIPAPDWKAGFKLGGKRDLVSLVASADTVTFAAGKSLSTVRPSEGRFPDSSFVLPKTPPLVRFTVNPDLLAELLAVALTIAGPESKQAEIFYYGPGKPIGIAAKNAEGQTLDGLLVPLT